MLSAILFYFKWVFAVLAIYYTFRNIGKLRNEILQLGTIQETTFKQDIDQIKQDITNTSKNHCLSKYTIILLLLFLKKRSI